MIENSTKGEDSMKKGLVALCLVLVLAACSGKVQQEVPSGQGAQQQEMTVGESKVGQAMPENELALPQMSMDLEQLNSEHAAVIYATSNSSWDNPAAISPDSLIHYYQYLISAQPQMKEEAGIYADEDTFRQLVPQESVEKVVCARFGLSKERVEQSRYYDAQAQAYELTGIGGGWSCQIVSSEQQGDRLAMQFVCLDAHDLPMSYGTLDAEVLDEGVQYRSLTITEYPSFQLTYPASYSGSFSQGAFLWDTGADTTQREDPITGEERTWRGNSLSDIVEFYHQQLKALDALGDEQTGQNSWSYAGSYSGGEISIQVQPNADGYRISCTIDQPEWDFLK